MHLRTPMLWYQLSGLALRLMDEFRQNQNSLSNLCQQRFERPVNSPVWLSSNKGTKSLTGVFATFYAQRLKVLSAILWLPKLALV